MLAAPFPDDAVGMRPEITCPLCKLGSCLEHKKVECAECGRTVTTAHVHLDYVGHAYVRERLNEVDPEWTWTPMAFDERGRPAFDSAGGLWIWLTIGGKTLPGYGDAPGKRGGNAVKEAIGDALRNGGQSFGVALDMWKREARTVDQLPAGPDVEQAVEPSAVDEPATPDVPDEQAELRKRIRAITKRRGRSAAQTASDFTKWSKNNVQFLRAGPAVLAEYLDHLMQEGKRR